ncbi:enoyl-CoA hydratase-related protein [soil metagenome]
MSPVLLSEQNGCVLTLTLNRPDRRNALNGELVDALIEELVAAGQNAAVRVVVLTGSGTAFSAGADLDALRAMQSASYDENLSDSRRLARLFETIIRLPKPVIGHINGHAIAGGCGLAAACDIVLADQDAKFGFTEVRIGFVPALVSVFVRRRVAEGRLRHLLLRGHVIPAEEALAIGLVDEIYSADALSAAVAALARDIATETSGIAVALTKELLADIPSGLSEGLERAAGINAKARSTDDCRAGVAAFLDKSDPPWRS